MKRALQALAVLQLALVVALGVRIFGVWTTPLPEFGEIPDLPATSSVPPPRPPTKIPDSVTEAVVDNDLFDEERGQGEEIDVDSIAVEEAPVPPPSTFRLVGVMRIGSEPVGIVLDPNVSAEQVSVRRGEMFGDYEIGDITASGITLLGGAGQRFQIPLRVEAASAGGVAAPAPGAAGTAGAPAPRSATTKATPPAKPVTAKPSTPRPVGTPPGGGDDKAMNARERAQAIAQRNAEARKAAAKKNSEEEGGGEAGGPPDPVQARLEALRQLREAAKSK